MFDILPQKLIVLKSMSSCDESLSVKSNDTYLSSVVFVILGMKPFKMSDDLHYLKCLSSQSKLKVRRKWRNKIVKICANLWCIKGGGESKEPMIAHLSGIYRFLSCDEL